MVVGVVEVQWRYNGVQWRYIGLQKMERKRWREWEWNGMESNGMEWNGIVTRLCFLNVPWKILD